MVELKTDDMIYPGKFEEFTQSLNYLLQEFRLEKHFRRALFDNFSNNSFYFSMKYLINHTPGFVPYISLALGFQFGRKETAVQHVPDQSAYEFFVGRQGKTSVNATAPVGINYFTSQNVFIGLNVTPVWTNKMFFDSNFGWAVSISPDFQFN